MGVLAGVRIIEFEGIGPVPFCGMTLADLGAEVIVIERIGHEHHPLGDLGTGDILKRGKRSVALDIRHPDAKKIVLELVAGADGVIEGFRPGVMEKLGYGPDQCLEHNPALVFGRATGWGQYGPLAQAAGHDINYIALSGALSLAGHDGEAPFAPSTLIGDVAGGALYLTIGMLAGILQARSTGQGNVVDAAIVDGSAHMMNLALTLVGSGQASFERGDSMLNGAPWFDSYRCACGGYITIGPVEGRFFRQLLERLGLDDREELSRQYDKTSWPSQRKIFAETFAGQPSAHWQSLLEGTDCCFASVLDPAEAAAHPHMQSRKVYYEDDGVLQAAPAPRFECDGSERGGAVHKRGADTECILSSLGYSPERLAELRRGGAIA